MKSIVSKCREKKGRKNNSEFKRRRAMARRKSSKLQPFEDHLLIWFNLEKKNSSFFFGTKQQGRERKGY